MNKREKYESDYIIKVKKYYEQATKDCKQAEEKAKQAHEEYSKLSKQFLKVIDNELGIEEPKAQMRVMKIEE